MTPDRLLVYAAMAGDIQLLEQRLAMGASPSFIDPEKGSALMQACHRGHSEIAQRLLTLGADPNVVLERSGKSAVQYALDAGHRMLVELCYQHGGTRSFVVVPEVQAPLEEHTDAPTWLWEFLRPFELHCAVGCCDWDAFDFSAAGVEAALKQGVTLQAIRSGAERTVAYCGTLTARLYFTNQALTIGRDNTTQMRALLRSVDEVHARTAS